MDANLIFTVALAAAIVVVVLALVGIIIYYIASKIINNIEENTGLTGLVNKYNPNYKLKLKIIDEALEKIGNNKNKTRKNGKFKLQLTYIVYFI